MSVRELLVTGNRSSIRRHRLLFDALVPHVGRIRFLETRNDTLPAKASLAWKTMLHGVPRVFRRGDVPRRQRLDPRFLRDSFVKSAGSFIASSRKIEHRIEALDPVPDLIFHVFGLSSPVWDRLDIPYVYYLDYTMALAKRRWARAAPYFSADDYRAWIDCERAAYSRAARLFSMSNLVRESLINDYGIDPEKITVVGSSGNFPEPYAGPKTFGSRQILVNGSDFSRKGGAIALSAFRQVREAIPNSKLVFIGRALKGAGDGVTSAGFIASPADLADLFLTTDVVIAPSHCDPFPGFLIEAMNYGVPCIAFPNDGMVEIVDHNETGIILEDASADGLARAVIDLLPDVDRLRIFSEAGRKKVRERLNWPVIAAMMARRLPGS